MPSVSGRRNAIADEKKLNLDAEASQTQSWAAATQTAGRDMLNSRVWNHKGNIGAGDRSGGTVQRILFGFPNLFLLVARTWAAAEALGRGTPER